MEAIGTDIEAGFNAFWLEDSKEDNWFLCLDTDQQVILKRDDAPDATCRWVLIDTQIENDQDGSYQTAYKILSMVAENEAVFLIAEAGGKKVGMGANPSLPEAAWIIKPYGGGYAVLQNVRYQTYLTGDQEETSAVTLSDNSSMNWLNQKV